MKYFKLLSLLFATILLFNNCEKNHIKTIKAEATILYEGNPAVDGCGYFLSIKENTYKPIELPLEFSIEDLIVNIEYQLLDTKWTCNWQENKYDEMKIINITKK